jgi:hypothetical protein
LEINFDNNYLEDFNLISGYLMLYEQLLRLYNVNPSPNKLHIGLKNNQLQLLKADHPAFTNKSNLLPSEPL